jgi:hypothetical protein
VSNVSEPQPARDDEGNHIPGEFQPRILEPLIIQSGEENAADIKSETGSTKTVESEKRDSQRSQKSVHVDNKRDTNLGDAKISPDEDVLVIPPVWTPIEREGNALLKYFFFAKVRLS